MDEKTLMEFGAFVEKLDQVSDDESAIEKLFMEAKNTATGSEELSETDLTDVAGGRFIGGLNTVIDFLLGEGGAKLTWKSTYVAARCIYDGIKYGNCYRTYSESYVNKLSGELEKKIPKWMKKLAS